MLIMTAAERPLVGCPFRAGSAVDDWQGKEVELPYFAGVRQREAVTQNEQMRIEGDEQRVGSGNRTIAVQNGPRPTRSKREPFPPQRDEGL